MVEELKRFTVDVTTTLTFGHDINTIEDAGGDVIQRKLELVFPAFNRRLFALVPLWRIVRMPRDRAPRPRARRAARLDRRPGARGARAARRGSGAAGRAGALPGGDAARARRRRPAVLRRHHLRQPDDHAARRRGHDGVHAGLGDPPPVRQRRPRCARCRPRSTRARAARSRAACRPPSKRRTRWPMPARSRRSRCGCVPWRR